MNANIQQISELERVLSVKNTTNWSFLSLFGKFALGGVLSRHSLDKKRGVDIVQLTLSLILFRINKTTVGSIYNECFYDLLETGKNYQTCMEQRNTAAICTHGLVSGGGKLSGHRL